MQCASARVGFTLLEVLIATVIGTIAITAARILLEGLADRAERIVQTASESDADANGERTLRELVLRLQLGTDTTMRFMGNARVARFTSWCEVPHGWQEQCTVTLAVAFHGSEPVLAASLSNGEILVLRRGFVSGELRYLADAAHGGSWVRAWGESITAPRALGVILDADTLILRIGERG